MRQRKALFLFALLGIGVLGFLLALWLATPGDDDDRSPGQVGRMTRMEQSGEMHETLEAHREMMKQMQESASPQMLELMNSDPMWQMMRSDDWARLDEDHQADIDRMLGRGSP